MGGKHHATKIRGRAHHRAYVSAAMSATKAAAMPMIGKCAKREAKSKSYREELFHLRIPLKQVMLVRSVSGLVKWLEQSVCQSETLFWAGETRKFFHGINFFRGANCRGDYMPSPLR